MTVLARVDMGADEYCDGTDSVADFDGDGFVNNSDCGIFSCAWLSSSGEQNYNEVCDIVDDEIINLDDLLVFVDDWLWTACWKMQQIPIGTMVLMGESMGGTTFVTDGSLILTETAEVKEAELTEEDIEVILEWIAEVSKDKEVIDAIGEDEWEEFIKLVKEALK